MPTSGRYPIFTYAEFDVQALCQLASDLRQNTACICDTNQVPASGSFNWAVFITFEDGVEWVLRSPHVGYGAMSVEITSKLLESEAATLKYVKENSDIPVPHMHSYSSTQKNDIGIPYILMSKAKGWPLQRVWKSSESGQKELSLHIKAKILFQLGAITFKLSQLRFDRIGSLIEQNGIFQVEECLSRGHILHERYSLEDIPRGPFASETQFYNSLIEAFIQHAEILPLSHHCFVAPVPCRKAYESHDLYAAACDLWNDFVTVGCKIDSSDNRLDYIIAGEALRDLISRWRQSLPKAYPNSFPLCHSDMSVNNIYVDDDYNVTCIIDWAFCSSVPESMVLIPPGLPQSRDELREDLIGFFRDGFGVALSTHRKETACPENGTLMPVQMTRCSWLLSRLLNFDSTDDYGLFASVWEQIYGTEKDLGIYFSDQRSLLSNIERHKEMQAEDQSPEKTRKAEFDYFGKDILRSSVAKSLSVVSQWNSQYVPYHHQRFRRGGMFIADSKLWNWTLKVIQEREAAL